MMRVSSFLFFFYDFKLITQWRACLLNCNKYPENIIGLMEGGRDFL